MKLSEWKSAIMSKNPQDREFASSELPEGDDNEIIPILISLLEDDNELVKLNICESLGYFIDKRVQIALRKFIKRETDELALGYAIESLGKNGQAKDLIYILKILEETESSRIKLFSISGIILGSQKLTSNYLKLLLGNTHSDIRHSSANVIIEVLEDFQEHLWLYKDLLKDRLRKEKDRSGIATMNNALNMVNKYLIKVQKK